MTGSRRFIWITVPELGANAKRYFRRGRVYPREMTAAHPIMFPWHRQAPRLGTGEEFAALRRLLEESGYSNEGLCRRLNVDDMDKYVPPPAGELIARPLEDPLDALMRLFYHSVFAEEAAVTRALPDGGLALIDSLGLVSRSPAPPGMVFGASAILPAAGVLTVCDRGNHGPDGNRCDLPADVVYPAIFDTANPLRTFFSVKRRMGRDAAAPPAAVVSSIKRHMGLDHDLEINGHHYSPVEISAMILGKLKGDAEGRLGCPIRRAVITVPAYFNDAQRRATEQAGTLAGLEVLRLVNEPTAAALAYGLDMENAHTVLVWDLGGGTFDVSVLELGDCVFLLMVV